MLNFTPFLLILVLDVIPSILCASFPPFSLVAPENNSTLPRNSTIDIGYTENHQAIDNLNLSASIVVTYPNTTTSPVWLEGPLFVTVDNHTTEGICGGTANTSTSFRTNQSGMYIVTWNLTYSTSPQNVTDSGSCGPGPFTFESFVFNQTYHVPEPRFEGSVDPTVATPFTTITSASILTDIFATTTSGSSPSGSPGSGDGDTGNAGRALLGRSWGCNFLTLLMFSVLVQVA
ncbi:hypothetical protein K435DRAFT_839864 [Dendrothele bispora CBS 962.96]|uniref:Uncharacterized protein n=1 Tax=Dendrothele bispora (strain CBS 962.96) TaxID=1314807 RepID=A0A4S8LXL1_DENBC|nr:hypothetical protein K435DRAFT_839864 [Dendrothele bispora CBS 962.96]